ncbi:MAG: DNA polymerase III subunit alpha [Candidatus Saganbacteria bacterium]|uniref:DNA polymerase III subunit alpha n=1 Tax=Candidatus Saganbacteria bacterium TaxID=2575572 RepID=A0A833P303_UNCSA|nr:MAG: DNA polymerase III subunit alpha [Candidatus Saganbacteria bacterium]
MLANLEDLTGSIPLVVFPKAYDKFQSCLIEDSVVIIKGRLNRDARTDEFNIMVDSVEPLAELEKVRSLVIEIIDIKEKTVLERLKEILLFFKGDEPVVIYYESKLISSKYRADINPELVAQIEELLGTGAVRVDFKHVKRG